MQASTIRPGRLVVIKVTCRGGVEYQRTDLERAKTTSDGSLKAKWETQKVVADPDEYEQALQVQHNANVLVRKACVYTAFGFLCPEDNVPALTDAITEARKMCEEFNSTSSISQVTFRVITGKVARDDEEAVQSINSEVRDLLETMKEGISNVDVKKIRDAANKARELSQMLNPNASEKIMLAINVARDAAKKIVKAGEAAAQVVDREAIKNIMAQRTAFLDLDEAKEVQAPAAAGRTVDLEVAGAEVDLEPSAVSENAPVQFPVQLDIEDAIAEKDPDEARKQKKREADKRYRDNKKKKAKAGKAPAKVIPFKKGSRKAS